MQCAPKLFLTTALLLALCLAGKTTAAAGESGTMAGMTAAHNRLRTRLGVPPLVWSDSLAGYAQNRADKLAKKNNCTLRHEPAGPYGENLYWASAVKWPDGKKKIQDISAQHVARAWQQEERNFDPQTGQCRQGARCGHYTQMIWRDSKEIGCGMAVCADKGQVWVCSYDPPGNFIGRAPY